MPTIEQIRQQIAKNFPKDVPREAKPLDWSRISNTTWESNDAKYRVGWVSIGKDAADKPILQWEAWRIGCTTALAQQLKDAAAAREVCEKHRNQP